MPEFSKPEIDPSARVTPTTILGFRVTIDANAQIGAHLRLGDGVSVGYNAVVEGSAELGDGVVLDHNSVVRAGTKVGRKTVVGAGSVLGQCPARAKTSTLALDPFLPPLVVGDECQIGVAATTFWMSRGTSWRRWCAPVSSRPPRTSVRGGPLRLGTARGVFKLMTLLPPGGCRYG